MSSFVLKIVAIITMLIDHSGDMIIRHLSIMNVIGRIAFPIFAFQLIVGYKNTSNIKNYIYRLLTFAIISQIPFSFMMYAMGQSILSLNIFFTLTMGVVSLLVYERVNNKFFKYFIIGILIILAQLLKMDYGAWGVILILFIYFLCPNKYVSKEPKSRAEKISKYLLFIFGYFTLCLLNSCRYVGNLPTPWIFALALGTFFPIIFMLLFNGKKGPSLKYFFYLFYPVHIIILDIINLIILK